MRTEQEAPRPGCIRDPGIILLLTLLTLLPPMIWYLVANWPQNELHNTPEIEIPIIRKGRDEARRIAREAGERNTRNYHRRLRTELEDAKRNLAATLSESRLDPQPAKQALWRDLIEAQRKQVSEASERLTHFERLLGK